MPFVEPIACRLRVHGLVQGVGFRPFVHSLARGLDLRGWVCNDENGVLIHLEGNPARIQELHDELEHRPPLAAHIESITREPAEFEEAPDFTIRAAVVQEVKSLRARIPTDRAICAMCCDEILYPANRRFRHPFATCTVCGPRYSILQRMPYERQHTSMVGFSMCASCGADYHDPADRRFHSEPIACPDCGPKVIFSDVTNTCLGEGWAAIVLAADALFAGKIVALKGLGGYQLLVRADDYLAVMRLRERKHRPSKPFAVMVRSVEQAERLAYVSHRERELLQSAENPIVLLHARPGLCPAVAPNLSLVGLFLPTTPLHVLLMSLLDFPVVTTSGNQSEEPILIDEKDHASLAAIADVFLEHDRPIVRRVDDSVVRVIDEQPMMIRLGRGFAPCALPALEQWAATSKIPIPPMLAVGGQQKTAIALWTGKQAILSQHIGDMDHPETRRVFADTVDDLARLYGCEPKVVVADLHPDYFTTQWAQTSGKLCFQVQHHHAHAVACMAEHGLLDREVLGVIWDGTGFGTDGTIWGGEMRVTAHDFQRVASLDPFALPGGEAAIREPNRIAFSLVTEAFKPDPVPDWLLDHLGFTSDEARALTQMIEKGVNAPRTSSAGRLFDGVAALLLGVRKVSYEGEAAVCLESVAEPSEDWFYPIETRIDTDGLFRGDWRPFIKLLVEDLNGGIPSPLSSAYFHNSLAKWASEVIASLPMTDIVIGGGCFQNEFLTNWFSGLKNVYVPSQVPPNDGGLAVGQLAIGMARWQRLATNS